MYVCVHLEEARLLGPNCDLKKERSWVLGGRLCLTMGCWRKSWHHWLSLGSFCNSLLSIWTPKASSMAGLQYGMKLATMSTNPNVSPPKNFFPLSSSSSALNASPASAIASSLSFPSFDLLALINAGSSCNYIYTYIIHTIPNIRK